MKITILQTNTKISFAPIAKLIKYFQKTKYSHYTIRIEVEGLTFIYDTTSAGVCVRSADYFQDHYIVHKSFEVKKPISFIEFSDFWAAHEGKGYGFSQVVGLLFKVLGVIKYNPFGRGAKRIICNEMIILFLNHFYDTNIKDTDSLDLNDTYKLLQKVL